MRNYLVTAMTRPGARGDRLWQQLLQGQRSGYRQILLFEQR
jgi:hypothetical protein